ncbi:hybrid sensor histidine kinase/response regulator [Oxalobacteraceae bacterium]|nr:hybrid sensor histidine kinase/response regulator [Oxalobacteraceae bacterium]
MSWKPSSLSDSQPDPEELPADASSFPGGMLALGLVAYFFSHIVAPWKPLTWWLLVGVCGLLRLWIIRRTRFEEMSERNRRWLLRGLIWTFMVANSSVAYFLYVPNDTSSHALLTVYLLGIATVLIAHLSGLDRLRILVSLIILGTPTGVRLIVEGLSEGQTITWILGCCALFIPIPLAQISAVQMRLMRHQFGARMEAENAAKALSAVALAKSRFFAAISHDLRQPVHAIGLYLDAIERVALESGKPQARQAVVGITLSWQTLNDLLSEVLDLARLEANMEKPALRAVALAPLIRELLLQHSSVAEDKGVRMIALVTPRQRVLADELMLKRVLSNLLGNALKYSPPGRAVVLAVRPAGTQWRIEVRDAGCGIAEQEQALIFSEFVQINNEARSSAHGFGLGLAIAKRLSELQGGEIKVRSRLGEGCCMSVALARQADEAERQAALPETLPAAPAPSSPASSDALRGRRVLLVEDDQLVGQGMLQLLQSWGAELRWAQSAATARQYAAACELALCDVRLPGAESGLILAHWLQTQGLRVMLISGETDVESRQFAARHGIPLLTKPVSPHALGKALEALASAPPAANQYTLTAFPPNAEISISRD